LKHFITGEPPQYVKLTMSVVQDFRFSWSMIRLFCITILYHNLLLFIDIFHI
jgi:hypothetical protein